MKDVPVDDPLYRAVPFWRLQHDTLWWASSALIAGMAAICVVAIETGAVSTELVSAARLMAAALLLIVRYAVPTWQGHN